ncbi:MULTISPECIES: ABC-F family ATP-binding cassette domain-containing protein [Alphaproteobacteria]|uniref:ABC-F family ATP-binding cassette domain-containing protein n=1 Tax=Alphaproteobacteria TaxID=28211 RepID=UPI000DE03EDD|nr:MULTISPECIES: ABC-F family ATP-binding cassette domain-containing protein [Alphaproteobacteria]MBY6020867.1 ABC-F family ATP-binding cassette domain-containing protein [Nitratireductor sp. DP7N14-4]MBN7756081.1 ABC-F family ATP-binding cassette domain-containing protein [Nitratireductor aquimarinus]MBN7778703.1 ABC-F family ATP-binding cassette domain-containing protein [Nitratireductor pacificus]MBN7783026.1 ABC-F family ATP-binding cassette domain-containing protein [Nitratireductor pacifi
MLTISNLSLRIAGRLLIDQASLSLPAGTKAGIVGRNGTGKTTLFRAITGDLASESGTISLPRGMRIGQVAQEAPGTEEPLIDIVLRADTEREALLAEAQTATDAHRIAEIQTRLTDIDAHSAEARAAAILSGLGFDAEAQKRPASSFSGGWRMRVALAAVLFTQPDLLLLDEPTNYLDLEGTLWLENYLSRYPHTVLLISHDRDLLNRAVSSIVHLEHKKLTFWRGGYDQFAKQYAEKAELQEKMRVKQDAQRKHMQAFVDRFRYKASKARQAQSRLKALERMSPMAAVLNETVLPFRFPNPEKAVASPIIALDGGTVGYTPGKPVLRGLTLRIDNDDRIALLGSNGNGKSTFAKLIADRLTLEKGTKTVAPGLKVSIFAQHQLDDLRPDEDAYQHLRRLMPDAPEAKVRARVAQFGLTTEKMSTPARDLSGGEKARLLMGLATFEAPHLLILDEPTNHLDIDSREALVEALNMFEGAVILISHDRHLIEATADRLWIVGGGTVSPFDGDMDDYRSQMTGGASRNREKRESDKASKADKRKEAARKRAALEPLSKEIKATEGLIDRTRKRIEAIEARLADTSLYDKEPEKVSSLAKERSDLADMLSKHEDRWLTLSTEYEEEMAS